MNKRVVKHSLLIILMLVCISCGSFAQLPKKQMKQIRKEAKTLAKEGWKPAHGEMPIEKQLEKSFLMQLEYDENMSPKYIMGVGISTCSDYATANAMWNSTTKTVYDPCPPGFRVPSANVFKVFSKTGATVESVAEQLNMWPDTPDLNGTTQTSGQRSKGGYFYCDKHTDAIPDDDRYKSMVYMPATGEWHGNKTVGTQLQDASEQLNQTKTQRLQCCG